VTGIVNSWYPGLSTFFYKSIGQWELNNVENRRQLFAMTEEERKIQHLRFLNHTKDHYFSPQVPFPNLTLT